LQPPNKRKQQGRSVFLFIFFKKEFNTMADTTSQVDAPATPPNGQAAPASAPAPQSPQTQAPASTDKPDVVKVEDFRRMQSVLTQREQAAARAAQQANAALQQMQQRLAQLETKDMEPEEAQAYQANQYIQRLQYELQQRDQVLAQQQAERTANEALYTMSQESEVPFSELRDYWYGDQNRSADDVWKYAMKRTKEKLTAAQAKAGQQAAAQLEDADATVRKEEREVDLGQGRAPRDEPEHVTALKNNDAQAFVKAYLLRNKQ
jgi:hypothetical protein